MDQLLVQQKGKSYHCEKIFHRKELLSTNVEHMENPWKENLALRLKAAIKFLKNNDIAECDKMKICKIN